MRSSDSYRPGLKGVQSSDQPNGRRRRRRRPDSPPTERPEPPLRLVGRLLHVDARPPDRPSVSEADQRRAVSPPRQPAGQPVGRSVLGRTGLTGWLAGWPAKSSVDDCQRWDRFVFLYVNSRYLLAYRLLALLRSALPRGVERVGKGSGAE